MPCAEKKEVDDDEWMRKLVTCIEEKKVEVEEDQWMRLLMT